jgi:hypothetical protein
MTTTNTPAAYLVTFAAPGLKLTPQRVREAARLRSASRFEGALPDVVTPVAALGRAVRDAQACPVGHGWQHAGTTAGSSRWLFCSSVVDEHHALISGASGATAQPDGTLLVDAAVPAVVAAALRAAYDVERGLVEPAKVNGVLSRLLKAHWRGAAVRDCTYVVAATHVDDELRDTLQVLTDLGGLGLVLPLADANAHAVMAPVAASVADDVAALVARVEDLTARATACADGVVDAADVRAASAETARRDLADARERLALWRDRLGLQLTTVEATMTRAETAMGDAVDAALAAIEARKAARRKAAA